LFYVFVLCFMLMYACVLNFSMYVSCVFDFIVLLPIGVIKNILNFISNVQYKKLRYRRDLHDAQYQLKLCPTILQIAHTDGMSA